MDNIIRSFKDPIESILNQMTYHKIKAAKHTCYILPTWQK